MGNVKHVPFGRYLQGWLQLMRLPNLLTVPGDPLAGAALYMATTGLVLPARSLFLGVAAALCLYIGGLLINDLADYSIDQHLRKERPLPRKIVPLSHAASGVILFFALGLFLAQAVSFHCLTMALILFALIFSYTFVGKSCGGVMAALNMGACRAMSTLLLIPNGDGHPIRLFPLLFAVATLLYVAGITVVSLQENRPTRADVRVILPHFGVLPHLLLLGAVLLGFAESFPTVTLPLLAVIPLALALEMSGRAARVLRRDNGLRTPQELRAAVGRYIHLLPWLQSWPLLLVPGLLPVGLALLLAAPLAMALGRRYAGS